MYDIHFDNDIMIMKTLLKFDRKIKLILIKLLNKCLFLSTTLLNVNSFTFDYLGVLYVYNF